MLIFLVAPKIDRRNMKHITVREGESVYIDVKVEGEPVPNTDWMFKDRSFMGDSEDRVVIHSPHLTKLNFDTTRRADTGVYTLIATNIHGTDKADVRIDVICKYRGFESLSPHTNLIYLICSTND